MSEQNLDDELIQDYLAECREHLVTIETDLLAIETGGAEIDEQLVNRVFRAAHSIKGGAGFFDLVKIRELGHKTENVLDLIRSRQMVPTSEVVSILLLAFDKLRELITNHRESNEADISEFVDALVALTTGSLPEDQKGSVTAHVELDLPDANKHIQVSAFDLSQARRGGKFIYLIEFDLIHDIERVGKTTLGVFNKLIKCGTILESIFDLDSAGTLDEVSSNRLMLEVLYATVLEPDMLAGLVDVPAERLRVLDKSNDKKAPMEPVAAAEVKPIVKAEVKTETKPATKAKAKRAVAAPPTAPKAESAPARPAATATTPVEDAHKSASVSTADATIRLNVSLLDSLMTLAGELVLGRNQLNESVRTGDQQGISAGAHRVSLVTSELQEAVSLTRMQPVSSLFVKFPRLVRDLASQLGKEVQLKLEGGDVELDKTILEGLSDPLTHMVRNCVDHGIEEPSVRIAAKKPAMGTITLGARHQAGQVVIEIADDGKGLAGEKIAASALAKGMITAEQLQAMSDYEKQELIFMPGVSTAEKLTNISGRGVGMDVVKTNLDKLGGKVEIDSVSGRGSAFRIKLPLTLAIIPSLLVSDCGERFAIPQVSVGELIRIPASQIAERTDRVGEAEMVLLRDRLVPLVHLADILGSPRPERGSRALNIVLVDTGSFEYGLVVGDLHDTVEIVVKPMGRHMQGLREYAGATILGDGQVAVILDVAGLAGRAGLSRSGMVSATITATEKDALGELHSLLLFNNAPGENCAVPIELVTRVARIRAEQVECLGGRRTMQYGGISLPLIALHDVAAVDEMVTTQQWAVVVFECAGRPLGLLVAEPLDMIETRLDLDAVTLRQTGVAGSALLEGRTTLMLDIFELADTIRKGSPAPQTSGLTAMPESKNGATVLVAEDSDFFRGQIKRLIEGVGYKVIAARDGQAAWEELDRHADEVCVVTTDIEMPRMDGLDLTKRIRSDSRFARLPIIALSSLASEEDMSRGLALGVSEYQVKLDQNQLLESIGKAARGVDLQHAQTTL